MRECSPPQRCHVSHVTCHVSHVTCHGSRFFLLLFWTKWWSLSVEGLLSTGPTPSSLLYELIYKVHEAITLISGFWQDFFSSFSFTFLNIQHLSWSCLSTVWFESFSAFNQISSKFPSCMAVIVFSPVPDLWLY